MPFSSSRILPRTLTALGIATGVSLPSAAHAQDGISVSPSDHGRIERGEADTAWAENWAAARRQGERMVAAA